jgi:hypothetical protein
MLLYMTCFAWYILVAVQHLLQAVGVAGQWLLLLLPVVACP